MTNAISDDAVFGYARERYARIGVDVEAALSRLAAKPISMHCWQGDDVQGFDQGDNPASGGIMTTGNYPGRARNFSELTADFERAAEMVPGKKRVNLHASYAVFTEKNPWHDRDQLTYEDFEPWVAWASEHGYGIDFNPTFFSHPRVDHGLTVSSPNSDTRAFWVRHGLRCREIAERIGAELNDKVLLNFWIPDGLKDTPTDRYGLRANLLDSLSKIYAEDAPHVVDAFEQKVFGLGVEGFTVGDQEFYEGFAAKRGGNACVLLDTGHFNPTENVADKLSALALFFPYLPLHVTRPMHWDSDHVTLFNDDLRELAEEIVRVPGAWEKSLIGMDFFDAAINRVGAWAVGMRSMQKALLYALLQPVDTLKELQNEFRDTQKMIALEQLKVMPFDIVWDEYCRREGVPTDGELWDQVKAYEDEVLSKRN
ncbi:MAG: L-rhamnose isomerase [Tractidigestivibacter sp.]|jgi:L-rhamnose isomerase|uniref:L-rhamnose isomerase n=1 Tax=Tractidigestivibacter sp. TaxID=2847320 RepID=UPI003D8B47E0